MLRKEVSTLLDIDSETMRYYENRNLISKPSRLGNGYRSYSEKNIEEIKFIQHCRSLGIGLEEIKVLQDLTKKSADCSSANAIVEKNLKLIETKIAELSNLQKQLLSLSTRCHTKGASDDCGIVKSLVEDSHAFKKNHLH
jgi:DNA-binding transcriptional MerR regulator